MVETKDNKQQELPPICPDGQHDWAIDPSMHGCGTGSGDHAVGELIVTLIPIEKGKQGAVCQKCFIIYDTQKRHEGLCWAYQTLSSW